MTELPISSEHHERAVEGASRHNLLAEDAIRDYFAELERQGVRLVEQPKCPKCGGQGHMGMYENRDPATGPDTECPRCGGSGFERLVPLGEAVEWLADTFPARYVDVAFERRFGGGER